MSAYCSPDDIEPVIPRNKLASLVGIDSAGDDGSEFQVVLLGYITLASSEIDTALGSLYQVPLPDSAVQSKAMMKSICVFLTVGYIYTMNPQAVMSESLDKMVANARKTLMIYGSGGNAEGRIFVPQTLPDALTNTGPTIVAPYVTAPYIENIALGTFGVPRTIQVS